MGTSTIRLRSIKSSLPFSLPLCHSRDKLFQALSRFSVLQAKESWAGPGNEATKRVRQIEIRVSFLRIRHIYVMYFTSCNIILYNVGWCVKGSAVHRSRQQSLVAEWLGLSVTVRVRARARECDFSVFFLCFFFSVLK